MAGKSLLDYALSRKGKLVDTLGSGLSKKDFKSVQGEIDVVGKEINRLMLKEYGPKLVKKQKGGLVKGYSKGGAVTSGTSSQTSGRRNSGIY